MTEVFQIGSLPPVGEVQKKMYAQVIRQDRFGAVTQMTATK